MAKKDKPAAPKKDKPGGAKKVKSNFLLEKGEKLIAALGGLGLVALVGLGVKTMASADNPPKIVADFKTATDQVNRLVNDDGTPADPLPPWATTKAGFPAVAPGEFEPAGPPFEPVTVPSLLRENPRVLGLVAWQVDPLMLPMLAYDVIDDNGQIRVGVVKSAPKPKDADLRRMRMELRDLDYRANAGKKKGRPGGPPGFPPGGPPGAPPAAPPAPPPGPAGGPAGQRDDLTVEYMTPEQAEASGKPLARTVYPLRGALVQAAFPLKAQVEEIRRALKLQTFGEALAQAGAVAAGTPGGPAGGAGMVSGPTGMAPAPGSPAAATAAGPGPVFAGIEVERRESGPNVDDNRWLRFNHGDLYYQEIRARMVDTEPDAGYLQLFLRSPDQMLTAPLPKLVDKLGSYPPVRLPQITAAMVEMEREQKPKPTITDFQKRFQGTPGDQNPYAPVIAPGAVPPGGAAPGGGLGVPPVPPAGTAGAAGAAPAGTLEVDHLLVRFIDPKIDPGVTYQYRVRVKMLNPNFGKKDLREPTQSQVRVLEGPWVEIPQTVALPTQSYLFAFDQDEYMKKAKEVVEEAANKNAFAQATLNALFEVPQVRKGHRAVVQMQAWVPEVRASGTNTEPVGTWVVAEMPVAVGEYIGKRQIIKLPLWSAAAGTYALRELTGGVRVWFPPQMGANTDKYQPKGWPVSFRTHSLLADFDGGRVSARVGDRDVQDESPAELLIVRPDGKVAVRSSAADMADKNRADRAAQWDTWLARVKDGGGAGEAPNQFSPPKAGANR